MLYIKLQKVTIGYKKVTKKWQKGDKKNNHVTY